MEFKVFMVRLLVAILAGSLIGLERQLHNKSAGLRTNSLVSLGAAIYVLLSFELTAGGQGDVTRIIGQVVTGVGFLGAGVILHQGVSVQGLTTAATIWCSAAIGCLSAAGFFAEAAISTLAIILVNFLYRKLDDWIRRDRRKNGSDQLSSDG